MKNLKRVTALLMVAAMVMTSFAACGKKDDSDQTSSSSASEETKTEATATPAETAPTEEVVTVEDVQLKVWGPQDEQDILKQMCDTFNENHPEWNITYEYGVVAEGDAKNELLKDTEAGADVFMFASGGVTELVAADAIYPLTKNEAEIRAIHSEVAVNSGVVDGTLYAVPFTPNAWFMYYNKSMYTEDDVKSLETMMAKDLGADVKNFSCDLTNSWYIEAFFLGAGCTLFGADGTDETQCDFNNDMGVKVGNYLVDLANNPKYSEEADGKFKEELKNGTLAAGCSGTWDAATIKEYLGDNYAACKLPTINIDGTDYQLSNFADFKSIGVNTATKYPLAAMALAEYLGGEECQKLRFEARQVAPTVLSLMEDPEVQSDPATLALSLQTTFSTIQPTITKMNDYWSPAEAFGNGIINGEITKDNMQEKLDLMVGGILSTLE